MNIIYASLNHINHNDNSITTVNIENSESLTRYANKLFDEITNNLRKKKYVFSGGETEVQSLLKNIILDHNRSDSVQMSAQRLLNKESDAQENLRARNMKVQILKGSLFQAYIEIGGVEKIIVCKADHSQFLDENSLTLRSGLPWDKKIFKAALIHVEDGEILEDIEVLDVNLSKYWWKEFLELKEKRTDQFNTEGAMKHLDSRVFAQLKKKYPSDYWVLRNSFVGYFRSKNIFDVEDFIISIIGNYSPIDPNLPIDTTVAKIRSLPDQLDFDNTFQISKQHITKRQSKKIKIAENIDLHIKSHINHFKETIQSGKTDGGQMYIQIFTEDKNVYDQFVRNDN